MSSAPKTANPRAEAAKAIAAALRASRSRWQVHGAVEDLGQSASLVLESGSRRTPGADPSEVDTLQRVRLNISKEIG